MRREKKINLVPVGIRLDRETARKLRMYAAERMLPMSAVVVDLVEAMFDDAGVTGQLPNGVTE
jgi:hypothetical protein